MTIEGRQRGGAGNMPARLLCLAVAALLLAGCAPPPGETAEQRCLQRTEGAVAGFHARWVRCPPGSPVVLPDDY